MTETFVPNSLETSNSWNTLSEASEQDMVRVSESMQKAKSIGAQIQATQTQNTKLAKFLSYLLNTVQDETVRAILIDLFSTPDEHTSSNEANMMFAVEEMVALFLPLYLSAVQEYGIDEQFSHISYMISLDEQTYLHYIHSLYKTYPLYEQIDKDTFSSLITALLIYHGLVQETEERTLQDIVNQVRVALG